jgi:medium-chain acyl-[acyl-carrier-protein] hydrolase
MNLFDHTFVVTDRWVSCSRPNSQARIRLFCFPYAGAGSSLFNTWSNLLLPEVELYLVHLPGRDKRVREPLQDNLAVLAGQLGDALSNRLDKPFAFFGHSMGALLCFEVARYLRRHQALQPIRIFISARQAPQLPDLRAYVYQLPDDDFLKTTEDLYGELPGIIKEDSGVLKLFLSILRADLTMLGTYQYIPEPPLDCPISVFGGTDDKAVTTASLDAWREQTKDSFRLTTFPGDHFFIHTSRQALIQKINQELL